jgi:hypothetical protein
VFAVVFFHRIYESVELGNASFDHQPPSKLVAPVRILIVRRGQNAVKLFSLLELLGFHGLTCLYSDPHNSRVQFHDV